MSATADQFVSSLRAVAADRLQAVYAVGSLALDDFSERQSNVDLVVVTDVPLDRDQSRRIEARSRALRHAGRQPQIWYTSWEDLDADGSGYTGQPGPHPLATPMTRAILRQDPMALFGPDWPVVAHDPETLKRWCADRLTALVQDPKGSLIFRRRISPLVLEAARLAQGAINGRVMSKSEAGDSIMQVVSSRHRRVLTDSVGYRKGAQFSMYWGPFERKSNALDVIRDLEQAATS